MARIPRITVVVVEDSEVVRGVMVRSLNAHRRITVVGEAGSGEEGRALVSRLCPDVVTLDVSMPGMDGLTCLQYIMVENPTPCVVVSAMTGESALETFEAYELGAVGVVQKPPAQDRQGLALFKRRLAAQVIRANQADVTRFTRARLTPVRRPPRVDRLAALTTVPRQLVMLGASTGGPRTLLEILPGLPADLGVPVVVVQHMPGAFTAGYAERLDQYCALPVREAREGEVIAAGTIYVAPGDFHLRLVRPGVGQQAVVELSRDRGECFVVPSIDISLESALAIYGASLVGVILTGLGDDGARAMQALHAAGGVTIAESEQTAVIGSMPRAVVERGAARHVLAAERIAGMITAEVRRMRSDV